MPIAVITSLLVQGCFCYLFEYFAANYFLNSGYTMQSALGSAAPIGDMMIVVGDALFGQGHGRTFMLIEAVTVFLALIGTTLSCINTGARVTYAMGKDEEVPEHFGMLHDKNLTPHRAIWTLAVISAVIGCIALLMVFGDSSAIADAAIAALPHGFWSSVWFATTHDQMAALPNTLTMIVLASNFGTFLLYMLSCIICIVAYQGHPNFSVVKHLLDSGLRRAGKPGLHGSSTSSGRSWGTAQRWSPSAPWVSRRSGPSTAESTSPRSSKAPGGRRWSRAARGGPDRQPAAVN